MKVIENPKETIFSPFFNGNKIDKPLISILLCAYNEEAIIEKNLNILTSYTSTLQDRYLFEIVVINDGSGDNTGELAEKVAQTNPIIKVFHLTPNQGLGGALQEGFRRSQGDFVITLDIDLSVSPSHIEPLMDKILESDASIIIASPTMSGGQMVNIPWHRRILSKNANRFLSFFSGSHITNFTCMVRAYNGPFIRSLNLRSKGMEIMPEILNKATLLQEKIDQVPACLDWTEQQGLGESRKSSMRIVKHIFATMLSGFLLHPFLFFIFPGLIFFFFSLYPNIWMVVHVWTEYTGLTGGTFLDRASDALGVAYQKHPHTFFTGLLTFLISLQLIALGLQSLQSKHYFEELYFLATRKNKNPPKN